MTCHRITLRGSSFGILVANDGTVRKVEKTELYNQWMRGHRLDYVRAWITQRGGTVEQVAGKVS